MKRHFINLTNGLEWKDELPNFSFVRIESTAIEKSDWDRILRDLDANLLMSLALGHECHVYDCGTNRIVSKTISVGVPFIRDFLHKFWIDCDNFEARTLLKRELKRKLLYYRRYLDTTEIRLFGHSRKTTNDGNKVYYRELAVT